MLSCRLIAGGPWWMVLRVCRWVIDSIDGERTLYCMSCLLNYCCTYIAPGLFSIPKQSSLLIVIV